MKRPVNRFTFYLAKRMLEFCLTKRIAPRLSDQEFLRELGNRNPKYPSKFKQSIFNKRANFHLSDGMKNFFVQQIDCFGPFRKWSEFETPLKRKSGFLKAESIKENAFVDKEVDAKILDAAESLFTEYYERYLRTHDSSGLKINGVIEDNYDYLIRYPTDRDILAIEALLNRTRPNRANAFSHTKDWIRHFPNISLVRVGPKRWYTALMTIVPVSENCYQQLAYCMLDENAIKPSDIITHDKKELVNRFFIYEFITVENKYLFDLLKNLKSFFQRLCDTDRTDIKVCAFARLDGNKNELEAYGFQKIGDAYQGEGKGFSIAYEIELHVLLANIDRQMITYKRRSD